MENKISILELIKSRRSCRRFKSDPVSDEDIEAIVEAASWAPSGENSQPWKFIIIKNKKTMEKIVELLPYKKYQKFLMLAPILIVVLVNPRKSMWHIIDGALATQNLMLEAWARGLGTCFSAWWPMAREELLVKIKELLQIPLKHIIITMTPLGYPLDPPEQAFRLPPSRKPLDKLILYETFSESE